MALQKTINLPNGASGSYIRVGAYTWDRVRKEASAHFDLFTTAAQAAANPGAPLCPVIAKIRLFGPKFDEYLSNAVLDGETATVIGQLYKAAKSAPVPAAGHTFLSGGGLPAPGLNLPAITLSDATDV